MNSRDKPCEIIPRNQLIQARCGVFIIGIAENERTLDLYKAWHKKLRGKYAKHVLANNLTSKNEEMGTLAQEIRQRLREFGDLQYLPGHCELCWHWAVISNIWSISSTHGQALSTSYVGVTMDKFVNLSVHFL